jgi:hypothetical protein
MPPMAEEPTEAHGSNVASAAEPTSAIASDSGWVTTDVAAAAIRVSPRTVRDYIRSGELKAKSEGEGVTKRWLVSIDTVHELRNKRSAAGELPRSRRDTAVGDLIAAANAVDIGELVAAVRDLEHRLGQAEARVELQAVTESTLRESLDRERQRADQERERAERAQRDAAQFVQQREQAEEKANTAQQEADRLREELEAEKSKGFWRRLFGG